MKGKGGFEPPPTGASPGGLACSAIYVDILTKHDQPPTAGDHFLLKMIHTTD